MEYERALFRVYERALEDLVRTQPANIPSPSFRNDGDENNGSSTMNINHLNDRSSQHTDNSIQFLWPLFIQRAYNNGYSFVYNRTANSSNRLNREGDRSRFWRIIQPGTRNPVSSSNFSRISADEENIEEENDDHRIVEMTALSQNFGLRRRNNSSSTSRDGSEDTSANLSTHSDSTISIEINHDVESGMNDNGSSVAQESSPTSTTRMAQVIASRQRQRNEEREVEPGGITQRGLLLCMRLCIVVSLFVLCILFILHNTYVGPRIARRNPLNTDMMDYRMTCLEYALQTRSLEERSSFYEAFGENEDEEDSTKDIHKELSKNVTKAHVVPLLGRNEILHIKIVYGDHCSDVSGQCSRVHHVVSQNMTTMTQDAIFSNISESETPSGHLGVDSDDISKYSTAEYWNKPAYKFSTTQSLMYLDTKIVNWYNMSIVNVTLSERCLSTGTDDGQYATFYTKWAQFFSQIFGMDTLLINQFMYSIKTSEGDYRDGYVQNVESKERWSYSSTQLKSADEGKVGFITWFFDRIWVIVISCISFFLVTNITAFIVRLLATSGVMIMFPIIAGLRVYGAAGIDPRVLDFSYPWVGRARNAIRQQGIHPFRHFITAHLGKLFLVYTMYESCQVAWSSSLYEKSTPVNLPLWIFGNTMVYEYFSMIFVRSALSVHLFPRLTFLYFIAYHCYLYSHPYGYFNIALISWTLLMLHAMIYTIIALEVPAFGRGAVSLEFPREVYNSLSWPEWTGGVPADFTLFLPLNSRYIPIHDIDLTANIDADDADADTDTDADADDNGNVNAVSDESSIESS